MNTITLRFKYTVALFILIAGSVIIENLVSAAEIDYPVEFTNGNTLTAKDLNDNFKEIKKVVTGNASVVSFVTESTSIGLGLTSIDIQTVVITTPGPGKVIVSFSATYTIGRINTSLDEMKVGITYESTTVDWDNLPSKRTLLIDGLATGEFAGSVASHAVFTVHSAGDHTITVWGESNDSTASRMYVSNLTTQATFVPHPYP